jgi:hypothetical protein
MIPCRSSGREWSKEVFSLLAIGVGLVIVGRFFLEGEGRIGDVALRLMGGISLLDLEHWKMLRYGVDVVDGSSFEEDYDCDIYSIKVYRIVQCKEEHARREGFMFADVIIHLRSRAQSLNRVNRGFM